jgi:hypothetical protein
MERVLMDAMREENEMTSPSHGSSFGGRAIIARSDEGTGGEVSRQRDIASSMCGAALSILQFHFPECCVLKATPSPTALMAEIMLDTGQTHHFNLPLDQGEPARAMLGALAQLERHIQLLVGRAGPSILALGPRHVSGSIANNVIHLVQPAPKSGSAVPDVEALCGLLANKFGQLAELFADLRADGDIDPEVLLAIAIRTEALAASASAAAVATQQISRHNVPPTSRSNGAS